MKGFGNFTQALQNRAKEIAKNDSISEGEDSLDIDSFEDDIDLQLPNVPKEEPCLGDSSASCSTTSSFADLGSNSKLIPFEMSDSDSDEELALDSEDESAEDSASYEKLSSQSISTQGSSLEFSETEHSEQFEQSDDLDPPSITQSNVSNRSLVITELTQSTDSEPPTYDSLYDSNIAEQLQDLKEPVPSVLVQLPPAEQKQEVPPTSTAAKILKFLDDIRSVCNEKAKEVDKALCSLDRRWHISETFDNINNRYGVSETVDGLAKDINEATVSISETANEVTKALGNTISKGVESIKETMIVVSEEMHPERQPVKMAEIPQVSASKSNEVTCAQSD